ncbi:hypothetical protein AB205_0035310 [Aquarana catesbeiana]|uniref:Uncharacterized protein n=1 Tax=Aquarana catesbeiana TaxID=8400 RepID=A0A2G9RQ75_AQUCT|nr:hypothetical protein AB205_0035310 [Aquarana catesbeiana]
MFSSTLHYPPTWTHPLVPPPPAPLHIPPPEPHVNAYLRRIVEVQERQYAVTRRLCHSLALHNRRQLFHYVAL